MKKKASSKDQQSQNDSTTPVRISVSKERVRFITSLKSRLPFFLFPEDFVFHPRRKSSSFYLISFEKVARIPIISPCHIHKKKEKEKRLSQKASCASTMKRAYCICNTHFMLVSNKAGRTVAPYPAWLEAERKNPANKQIQNK